MQCLVAAVSVRPSSLGILHQLSLLSHRPLTRSISSASFTCDRKTRRSRVGTHAITPLPGFCRNLPRTPNLGLHPHRLASSSPDGGTGWYESVANSTPVHLTEQLLVSAQEMTGLPWWASIACTTLALRTVITLPLGAYQMAIIAKVCVKPGQCVAQFVENCSSTLSVKVRGSCCCRSRLPIPV